MIDVAVYGTLLVAGLAGSLHCVGMCGPILVAFSRAFASDDEATATGRSWDFVGYHVGRIWTYALLGLVAATAAGRLRESSLLVDWQRGISLLFCAGILLAGLTLTGAVPASARLETWLEGCGIGRFGGTSWFARLLRTPGLASRILLGSVMGLLPCGLVYAALVVAAGMPSPAHGALAMLVFGLGTVPSLSAVILAGRIAPPWLRVHGTRIVGVALLIVGVLMVARTLLVTPEEPCPLCAGGTEAENPDSAGVFD